MPGSRRSPGARPAGSAGTKRRPATRTTRGGPRPGRETVRRRAGVENSGDESRIGPPPPPPPRPRASGGKPSITGRAAVLTLVLAVLLVSYAYPLRTWYEQHNERSALEQEAVELREQVEQLEVELELWDDPAYVAIQARERLGFVMPGEQGYVVVHPGDDEEDDPGPEGLPPAGDGAWHERLWSSLQTADEIPDEDLP